MAWERKNKKEWQNMNKGIKKAKQQLIEHRTQEELDSILINYVRTYSAYLKALKFEIETENFERAQEFKNRMDLKTTTLKLKLIEEFAYTKSEAEELILEIKQRIEEELSSLV